MPNHFHFLIRIKSAHYLETLTGFKTLSGLTTTEKEKLISKHLSLQFSHLFNSYTQALNKQENRKGALFMRPFKRIRVNETKYLIKLVHYIHFNPVESKLCYLPEEWPHSSYPNLISNKPTFIDRSVLINWFDDLQNFKYIHKSKSEKINF
jgi:REP element-mobilizing transposase RayT